MLRSTDAAAELTAWLVANAPEADPTTIVHGDYKIDNVPLILYILHNTLHCIILH